MAEHPAPSRDLSLDSHFSPTAEFFPRRFSECINQSANRLIDTRQSEQLSIKRNRLTPQTVPFEFSQSRKRARRKRGRYRSKKRTCTHTRIRVSPAKFFPLLEINRATRPQGKGGGEGIATTSSPLCNNKQKPRWRFAPPGETRRARKLRHGGSLRLFSSSSLSSSPVFLNNVRGMRPLQLQSRLRLTRA